MSRLYVVLEEMVDLVVVAAGAAVLLGAALIAL